MTLTQAELRRLTVPQLKSLCKERKITGYAKLPKDAIIAKLLAPAITTTNATAQAVESGDDTKKSLNHAARQPETSGNPSDQTSGGIGKAQPTAAIQEPEIEPISSFQPPEIVFAGHHHIAPNSAIAHDSAEQNLKRKRSIVHKSTEIPVDPVFWGPNSETDKRVVSVSVANSIARRRGDTDRTTSLLQTKPERPPTSEARNNTLPKRFKPLLPSGHCGHKLTDTPLFKPPAVETYYSLESPTLDIPILNQITMPVSLSQRKKVRILSVALSMISLEDLLACSLVSKTFRYAAHLAAYHQLCREFPGRRLGRMTSRYQPTMTNMWPYLIQRQQAYSGQRLQYEQSFLGKALKGIRTISNALWKNPDHELQTTVALRFLLTRVYFVLSTGATLDALDSLEVIVDTQEVVKGEIWKVVVSLQGRKKSFHVVEATCEVIGETESRTEALDPEVHLALRDDWSLYIAERKDSNVSECLWDHLQWTNHEEYDKGISKLWIKQRSQEGSLGHFKTEAAKRYVLACVMANGISGTWKSSQMMYQEFKGIPDLPPESSRKKAMKLNMFIPEHHNVESLHFTTSDGEDLHRAIAVVQTHNRGYYILKDNGMQIGSEEEGIPLAWRRLLGCTSRGVPR